VKEAFRITIGKHIWFLCRSKDDDIKKESLQLGRMTATAQHETLHKTYKQPSKKPVEVTPANQTDDLLMIMGLINESRIEASSTGHHSTSSPSKSESRPQLISKSICWQKMTR